MPKAAEVITFRLGDAPRGILSEISPDCLNVGNAVYDRLHRVDAILQIGKRADELPLEIQDFMAGVQDLVGDCLSLLDYWFANRRPA